MIFVQHKSEEWHDEFKASLFRYFKHLPIDHKIVRNLNDCLFIQMPPLNDLPEYMGISRHPKKEAIRPEIEFFYKLCNANDKAIKLSDNRRVVLLTTEKFENIFPNIEPPPCFTKIPFTMQEVIDKRIASDDSQCGKCEWGKKTNQLQKYTKSC